MLTLKINKYYNSLTFSTHLLSSNDKLRNLIFPLKLINNLNRLHFQTHVTTDEEQEIKKVYVAPVKNQ